MVVTYSKVKIGHGTKGVAQQNVGNSSVNPGRRKFRVDEQCQIIVLHSFLIMPKVHVGGTGSHKQIGIVGVNANGLTKVGTGIVIIG